MKDDKDISVQKILADIVLKRYPEVEEKRIKTLVRELVFAPSDRPIKLTEIKKISAEDLRFMIAHAIECPPDQESLSLRSDTDTREYFDLLKTTTNVLKDLNDGYVSEKDAHERTMFLSLLSLREKALMCCLGLYQESHAPSAPQRMTTVRYKVQKIREIRSAIMFLTRQDAAVITTKSEFDAAKPYYQYFKNLQNLPFGYDAPYEKRKELGISRSDDFDLAQDYDYYKQLLNEVLDEMAEKEDPEESAGVREKQKRNKSSDKMQEFSGR